MVTLLEIMYLNPDGDCVHFQLGDRAPEHCLQLAVDWLATGVEPIAILFKTGRGWHCLPADIFAGADFIFAMQQLQLEWEALLMTSDL